MAGKLKRSEASLLVYLLLVTALTVVVLFSVFRDLRRSFLWDFKSDSGYSSLRNYRWFGAEYVGRDQTMFLELQPAQQFLIMDPGNLIWGARRALELTSSGTVTPTTVRELRHLATSDQENALYNYLLAATLNQTSEVSFEEVLAEFRRGTGKERCQKYTYEALRTIQDIYNSDADFIGSIEEVALLQSRVLDYQINKDLILNLCRRMSSEAISLYEKGDKSAAKNLLVECETPLIQLLESAQVYEDYEKIGEITAGLSKLLPYCWGKIGEPEAAEACRLRLTELTTILQPAEPQFDVALAGTYLQNNTPLLSLNPSVDELESERRMEYAFAWRLWLGVAAAAVLVGSWVCAVVLLVCRRYSALKFNLIGITWKRFFRIMFWAVLLPLSAVWILTRFDELTGYNYSIKENFWRFIFQLLFGFSIIWCATIYMTKRYVYRYAHREHLPVPPFRRWPIVLVGGLVILLALAGLIYPWWQILSQILFYYWCIVALVYLLRRLNEARSVVKYANFYRTFMATLVFVWCSVVLFLCVLAIPLIYIEERYWVAQDTLVFANNQDQPGYKTRLIKQIQDQLDYQLPEQE